MRTTQQLQKTWDIYTAGWQAQGAEAKAMALHESVDVNCVYRDPLIKAEGHAALIDYMLGFHEQVPGGFFKTTSFRAHSACSASTWQMCNGDGAVLGEGVSYAEYSEDGKLVAMTGFFDLPPQ